MLAREGRLPVHAVMVMLFIERRREVRYEPTAYGAARALCLFATSRLTMPRGPAYLMCAIVYSCHPQRVPASAARRTPASDDVLPLIMPSYSTC